MQNNALVRIFAILFVIVSIYQLSFTFISSNEERKAKTFAKGSISNEVSNYLELRDKIESDYLDSVGQISLYGITSYNDAKKQFSLRWNDPKISIKWPIKKPILSKRDKKAKLL